MTLLIKMIIFFQQLDYDLAQTFHLTKIQNQGGDIYELTLNSSFRLDC